MLERLLDEFSDIAIPAFTQDTVALARHAGRMHKLRGSAGMLGARSIHRLAGEAEAACSAGAFELVTILATRLAAQLQRLRQHAAPVLTAARAREEAALTSADEFDSHALTEFVALLRQQSLSAMDRFSVLSPQLRGLMDKDSFKFVRDHIDNLQFNDATEALDANQL